MEREETWMVSLSIGEDFPPEKLEDALERLGRAVYDASAEMLRNFEDGHLGVAITAQTNTGQIRHSQLFFDFRIAELPGVYDDRIFEDPEEASAALNEYYSKTTDDPPLNLAMWPQQDGKWRLGISGWESDVCFKTREEAEDALQAFEQPQRFKVISAVGVSSSIL
jgi:hypothetical protein